ncbi:MAG TPA: hypothetical protein VHV10_05155 [Ktedonobacteraceae bacterium]|nr:hypothetical protein [Ktedonobacteraceae bacterium]
MSDDTSKSQGPRYLHELINGKPIPRFGTLMRQFCEAAGMNQPWLADKGQSMYNEMMIRKYGKERYEQMLEEGTLPKEEQSSMLQQAVSRVIIGVQRPSYIQTYIWISVIEEHYNNEEIKRYFEWKGLEMPVFTEEMYQALWALSGHQPPDAVNKAVAAFSTFNHTPRRLPRSADSSLASPRTEPNLPAAIRRYRDTDKLNIKGIKELQ